MKNKFLFLAITSLFSITSLAACGNNNQTTATPFKVLLVDTDYGDEFLHTLIKNFLAEKNETSPSNISLEKDYVIEKTELKDLSDKLSSKSDSPDLVIDYSLPYKYVANGLITDISDVFEQEVLTRKGKKKLKDFKNY